MMRIAKIKDHPTLIKDLDSCAILNTDIAAVRRHEERLNKVNKELQRDADISQLKTDMNELKSMLLELLQRK
jgi:hypothetical protein